MALTPGEIDDPPNRALSRRSVADGAKNELDNTKAQPQQNTEVRRINNQQKDKTKTTGCVG